MKFASNIFVSSLLIALNSVLWAPERLNAQSTSETLDFVRFGGDLVIRSRSRYSTVVQVDDDQNLEARFHKLKWNRQFSVYDNDGFESCTVIVNKGRKKIAFNKGILLNLLKKDKSVVNAMAAGSTLNEIDFGSGHSVGIEYTVPHREISRLKFKWKKVYFARFGVILFVQKMCASETSTDKIDSDFVVTFSYDRPAN